MYIHGGGGVRDTDPDPPTINHDATTDPIPPTHLYAGTTPTPPSCAPPPGWPRSTYAHPFCLYIRICTSSSHPSLPPPPVCHPPTPTPTPPHTSNNHSIKTTKQAPAFNPAELAMAVQGLARLLPLALAAQTAPTDPTDISSNSNGSDKSPHLSLTPPALLPRLAAALARTLRKPPPKQTRADDGLLGSPHLALTIAGLPPLARAAAAKTNNNAADGSTAAANAFRSPEFLDLVIARVEERGGGMQAWEREMVVEGLRALGVAPASVPPSVLLAAGKEGGG